jgi:hypothetical protein
MRWRDIRFEKPTEADGDEQSEILMLHSSGFRGFYPWTNAISCIAWMPTSELPTFTPIPDPPDGWRFVEKGEAFDKRAKFWSIDNEWITTDSLHTYSRSHTYIVPIDPPAPQYRPFANAAEFLPHRDKWWRYKSMGGDEHNPPALFNNVFHCNQHWSDSFETKVFCDGTPFGVRVDQ